jgi:hypothetical protein
LDSAIGGQLWQIAERKEFETSFGGERSIADRMDVAKKEESSVENSGERSAAWEVNCRREER